MAEATYAPICPCSCDLCVLSCLLRRFGPILLLYASNININGNDTVIFFVIQKGLYKLLRSLESTCFTQASGPRAYEQ